MGASLDPPKRELGRPPSAASWACATLLRMRVVIADDHRLVLDGIRRALEDDGGFEIVGETQSGTQVLPLVGRTSPDLVLLDVRMPHMDGLACLDEIKRRHPDIKVVMLSASTNQELIDAAIRRGAAAYVVKTVNPDDLPATLRQALEGNIHTAVSGEGVLGSSADREVPSHQHLPQARREEPNGGDPARVPARACGKPDLRRRVDE